MIPSTRQAREDRSERGSTLFLVAGSLVAILVLAGLAIDLVALYVGRSEAQRAADAAALAGAKTFVVQGYSSGGVTASSLCPSSAASPPSGLAGDAATSVAQTNKVGGQILTSDAFTATCDFSHNVVNGISSDPLITVSVKGTIPTYFMTIFGVRSENVSATATAESFDPGTAGCNTCIKPFFLPNCDPAHTVPANPGCPGSGYFVDPITGAVEHSGNYPTGVRGEPWTLHTNAVASKWLAVAFAEQPLGTTEGSNCNGTMSQNQFEQSVLKCTTKSYACGSQLCAQEGKAVGPVGHSVGCLISYGQTCTSQNVTSTDTLTSYSPLQITPGTGSAGSTTQSASLITVPIFDGSLDPGNSNGLTVTIVGWMQVFIKDVKHQGQDDMVDVTILNVSGCGNAGGGSGNCSGPTGGGSSFLPIRLVQNP